MRLFRRKKRQQLTMQQLTELMQTRALQQGAKVETLPGGYRATSSDGSVVEMQAY